MENKMRYPVMTEKQVATKWNISLKTLRRWRLGNEGPVWHKLFRLVRYHEADVLEFERRGAQHLMSLLGVTREFTPAGSDAGEARDQGNAAEAESHYLTAKEVSEATSLPIYLFRDQAERNRKRVPHLMLVGNLRFSLEAILHWEIGNSVPGHATKHAIGPAVAVEPVTPARVPRWHELARALDGERFNSAQ